MKLLVKSILMKCAFFYLSGIIAVNAFVFTCWQIPALRHFMTKWFTASAFNGKSCHWFSSFHYGHIEED